MPEYAFSCQLWCHYWRWKCVQCTSEMQEPRWGRLPLLANLKLGYWSSWHSQYSMAVQYMWQEVHGRYDRHSSGPLTAGWEMGTADRHLATCLRASVAHDTAAVHSLQSNDKWFGNFVILFFCFVFHVFVFPVLYFPISISFSFERIFTFLFPFVLTDSLFLC